MFEKAIRLKFRFDTVKGSLTVEDLWDLPLIGPPHKIAGMVTPPAANLDEIAKSFNRQLKNSDEESFVKPTVTLNEELQEKFNIVKYIIGVKVKEREEAAAAASRREKKQLIMSIIDKKKNEQLSSSSLEDLQKMLNEV